MSLATDKLLVGVTASTRPRECSTCRVRDLRPDPRRILEPHCPGLTIEYCDSPYHIIFTNVKMIWRCFETWWGCLVLTTRHTDESTICRILRPTARRSEARTIRATRFSGVRVPTGPRLAPSARAGALRSLAPMDAWPFGSGLFLPLLEPVPASDPHACRQRTPECVFPRRPSGLPESTALPQASPRLGAFQSVGHRGRPHRMPLLLRKLPMPRGRLLPVAVP
jgi:hypothetical protein